MTATNLQQNAGQRLISAKEERKLRKPLIERKRRERINLCLDQLRETVVGAFSLDQSKLEKADILEMTVKHLQNIQGNRDSDPVLDAEAQQRYSTGYIQCMQEVHNLLLSCDWMDKTLGSRLLNHLLKSLPRSAKDRPQLPNSPTSVASSDELDSPKTCPPSPVLYERAVQSQDQCSSPMRTSPHLSVLEMWRPW
ncbi:hairy-related 8.2 isoform X1 [Pimephales promelas]|uniref:hairy-related 8.2 isoform X1 n=1 Tax=Pimephales promelas TaxID=90988 RepID=UPI0019556033|nr:hairy-related 8.2 isoform X1 [Pimephales promelas]KAG1935274.1 transcription factor HES-1 [Pimephales promelas]